MKTAGKENLTRWTILFSNRALGAGGQNGSCSIQWAAKQEKFGPMQKCFFLTSTFIEVVSRGQCNTGLQSIRWSVKSQCFSWPLI
jgi:hypothetical protein